MSGEKATVAPSRKPERGGFGGQRKPRLYRVARAAERYCLTELLTNYERVFVRSSASAALERILQKSKDFCDQNSLLPNDLARFPIAGTNPEGQAR